MNENIKVGTLVKWIGDPYKYPVVKIDKTFLWLESKTVGQVPYKIESIQSGITDGNISIINSESIKPISIYKSRLELIDD